MFHKPHFGMALVLIGLVIVIFAGGLYFSSEKMGETQDAKIFEELANPLTVSITFCNHVDDVFNCDPNPTQTYTLGDNIKFLITITNLKSSGANQQYIDYSQSREIYLPNGQLIDVVSGEIISERKEVGSAGYYNIPIKNELLTDETDQVGEYKTVVNIVDRNTGERASKESYFNLVK